MGTSESGQARVTPVKCWTGVRECVLLSGVLGLLWLAESVPAYQLAGWSGVRGSLLALAVNLVPGLMLLRMVASHGKTRGIAIVLTGTAMRTGAVAVSVLIVKYKLPAWSWREFIVWVVLDYLVCLVTETWLVMSLLSRMHREQRESPANVQSPGS